MSLKFTPPYSKPSKTKEEYLAEALQPTVQALPALWDEFMQRGRKKKEQQQQMAGIREMFPDQNIPESISDPNLAMPLLGKRAEILRASKTPMSGGGYYIPRGVDPETNKPVYSHSKQIGLFFDDGTQYRGAGVGKLTLNPMSGEMLDKEDAFSNLGFSMNKIKESYSDDLVGPADARVGRGKQYLEGVSTPEAANFYSNLSDLKNQIIYLKSGKQINEQEFVELLNTKSK